MASCYQNKTHVYLCLNFEKIKRISLLFLFIRFFSVSVLSQWSSNASMNLQITDLGVEQMIPYVYPRLY